MNGRDVNEGGLGDNEEVRTTTDLPAADSPEPGAAQTEPGQPGPVQPGPVQPDPGQPGLGLTEPAAPPAKRKRGLESLGDMIQSLSVVMIIVFGLFFFALPPSSDRKAERDINPAADVRSFTQVVPTAPVPGGLPSGWRSTVAAYGSEPNQLRIGYLTAANHYVEYAAVSGPAASYVADITDRAAPLRSVDIAGQPWGLVQDSANRQSLVRAFGQVTVVVGTLRSNSTLDELIALASSLRPVV